MTDCGGGGKVIEFLFILIVNILCDCLESFSLV